ncbi:MAG: hypothetical protein PHU04_03920 [Candidatus Peribacteraceae bacterium]|nr:hypothetical protein [Candidatus Peribacteraceae bacterium]
MSQPERFRQGNEIARETQLPFAETLNTLEKTVGPSVRGIPDEVTEDWLKEQLADIVKDHHIDTFNEQYLYNELLYRRASLQRQKNVREALQRGEQPNGELLKELVVANQAVTYHEYFRSGVNHVLSVMRRYETMRGTMPHVPPYLVKMEVETKRYIEALQGAVQERVAFSNVILLEHHVEKGFGNDAVRLRTLRDGYMGQLSDASRQALGGDLEQKLIRANQLNQRIVELLSGRHGLQGIEEGYVPKRMYLELLKYRYKQLLDSQKQIAVDTDLASSKSELAHFTRKFEMAQKGQGKFTEEDVARSEELRKRIRDVNGQFALLGEQRRAVTQEILGLTDELAVYNIEQTELADIQNQLGKKYSFEGVAGISPLSTPPEVRDAIAKNMETRKQFHLTQMGSFLTVVEEDVLHVGLRERVEKKWNEDGREALRLVTHRLAGFFTFAVPEAFGMKEAAKDALTQPLDEAMGWPSNWEDLSPEEQEKALEVVREKTRSVLTLIENFDTSTIQNFRETVSVLQGMPPMSQYALEDVKFDENDQPILPEERVTTGNRDALIRKYGGGTVHLMLIRQFHAHWGTQQPPSGFFGEYAEFLHGVDAVIDVHLDVGRALHVLGDRYMDLAKLWMQIALVALGVGILIGAGGVLILKKVTGRSVRAILNGAGRVLPNLPRYAPRMGASAPFLYRAYLDYQKIGDIAESIERQRIHLIAELEGAGFVADPPGQESTFRYKSGGTDIKVNVSELKDALEGQETAQGARVVGSLAQAALILRFGISRAAVPLMIAEVGVETIRYGLDQESDKKFLLRAPAWLIAKINLEQATGETGYSMLAKASGEMMTDSPFGDAEDSQENREKRDIREKMLFQILMEELRQFPELRQEILGGTTHPLRLDLFYRNGFTDVFLPVFYARLFELVGKGRLSWEEISKGQIDSDWNIPLPTSPKITLVELRRAMRESVVFSMQHTREEQYLSARKELVALDAQIQKEWSPELQAKRDFLDSVVQELGKQEVFGKKLSDVPEWGDRVQTGTTRASSVAKLLFAGAPKHDHRVEADTVAGLPEGFNFGDRTSVYSRFLADNPALRAQLNQVLPRTTAEPEGRVFPSIWSKESWQMPTGFDSRNARLVDSHFVANGVSEAVGLPKMRDEMFGTTDSVAFALKRVTEGSIKLFSEHAARTKQRSLEQNAFLESSLYKRESHTPIVLTRYEGRPYVTGDTKQFAALTEMLRDPSSGEEAFSFEKLVAVCFEGKTLSNGHQIVLATYMFGDVASRSEELPRFYVMQRAAGTSATARWTSRLQGFSHASGGASFLRQPGASAMLDAVRVQLGTREEQRQEAAVKQEAAQREQMTQWEREKPVRDQKQALQEEIVRAAEQRARQDGVVGYVPGRYVRDEEKQRFSLSFDTFQSRYGDWILELRPQIYVQQELRAADTPAPKRGFAFHARNEKTGQSYAFNMDIDDLRAPSRAVTEQDIAMATALLTAPLNLAGHPQEKDKKFVEAVRRYELRRLLDIAKYKGSHSWNASEFRDNLEQELWPYYRDAKNKDIFLNTLLNNLTTYSPVTGGVFSSTYGTILKNMKQQY